MKYLNTVFILLLASFSQVILAQQITADQDTVCVGTTVTFTVSGISNEAYADANIDDTTNVIDTLNSVNNTFSYTYTQAGTYTAAAFLIPEFVSYNAQVVVVDQPINAPQIVSSVDRVCDASSVTFSLQGDIDAFSNSTFAWKVNGVLQQTAETATSMTYFLEQDQTLQVNLNAYDANLCGIENDIQLSKLVPTSNIQINLSSSDADCGLTNGAVTSAVLGGSAPLTYRWSNGASTQNLINVKAGLYTLSVTDADGCESFRTTGVSVPDGQGVTIDGVDVIDESCVGASDGSAELNYTVNSSGYALTYFSTGARNTHLVEDLTPGGYFVWAEDENGCGQFEAFNVSGFSNEFADVDVLSPTCSNADGEIRFFQSAQTSGWQLSIDSGLTYYGIEDTIKDVAAGIYYLKINTGNCEFYSRLPIVVVNQIANTVVVSAASVTAQDCNQNNGSLKLKVEYDFAPDHTLSEVNWLDLGVSDQLNGQKFVSQQNLQAGVQQIQILAFDSLNNVCEQLLTYEVPSTQPSLQELCVATVIGQNNTEVRFEPEAGFDLYNIYREDYTSKSFHFLKQINVQNGEAVFLDNQIDAGVKSHRYSVKKVDACEAESDFALAHRTTHLTHERMSNSDIQLAWQPYQGIVADSVVLMLDTTGSAQDSLFYAYKSFALGTENYTLTQAEIMADTGLSNALAQGKLNFLIEYASSDSCAVVLKANSNNNTRSNKDMCCRDGSILYVAFANANPVSAASVCDGSIEVEVYGGAAPYTFTWSQAGLNGSLATDLCAGYYQITVTDQNNNTVVTGAQVELTTSLVMNQVKGFEVYPRPAKDKLFIEAESPITQIELFDGQGKRVLSQQVAMQGQVVVSLSEKLSKGFYVLVLHTQQGVLREKILTER